MKKIIILMVVVFSLNIFSDDLPPENKNISIQKYEQEEILNWTLPSVTTIVKESQPFAYIFGVYQYRLDNKKIEQKTKDGEESLNGNELVQHYFLFGRISLINDETQERIASGRKLPFSRTVNIYDNQGNYIGQVYKKWFTWFSGKHHYGIKNAQGQLLATATVELADSTTPYKPITLREAVMNKKGDVLAKVFPPRNFNPSIDDENSNYNKWQIKIAEGKEQQFKRNKIDPRIIALCIPYVSRWDYHRL